MFKFKIKNIFYHISISIAVLFLCTIKTYSAKEISSINSSLTETKTQFNSTQKTDYYSTFVTNAYKSISLNKTVPEFDLNIIENVKIASYNYNSSQMTPINAHNNYIVNTDNTNAPQMNEINKIDDIFEIHFNDSKEFVSQQNSSRVNNVIVDDKLSNTEIFTLPYIPSNVNNDNMNESLKDTQNSYNVKSKALIENNESSSESEKTFAERDIKQTSYASTLKTNLIDIESQLKNNISEQNVKQSNVDVIMDVIIAETTQVKTTTIQTTEEYLTEMITSMLNNLSGSNIESMSTISAECNASVEIKYNTTEDYVIVDWNSNVTDFCICLYLSDSECSDPNNNSSKLCDNNNSVNNSSKCLNEDRFCHLKRSEKSLNYIIGWYGCNDSAVNTCKYTNCTFRFIDTDNNGSDNRKAIVITLAIVVPLIICVALFLAFRYLQKKKSCFGVKNLKQIPLSTGSSRKPFDKMPTDGSTAINMDEVHSKVNAKSKPIVLTDFNDYYLSRRADSNLRLAEEYEELKGLCVKKKSAKLSQIAVNKPKNRFVNILPYDHSIVALKSRNGELGSDYINANFIPGFNCDKEYIACQGPLKSTVNDFFRMIIEHNVHVIVMLTQCMEKGRQKCEKYWPSDYDVEESSDTTVPTLIFDDITIELLNERTENDFIIRDLKLVKDNSYHLLTQFHFSQWPDFGCPQNPLSLIHLIEVIRKHLDSLSLEKSEGHNSPIVVHCSAGVGRSGTFIAVDQIWQKLIQLRLNSDRSWAKDVSIDIFGTVYEMRKYRPNMVQTEDQYIYIYECVKHLIERMESQNSNHISEEHKCENEDVNELSDNMCLEEDIESKVEAVVNNADAIDETANGAFLNHQFSLEEEVSENTAL